MRAFFRLLAAGLLALAVAVVAAGAVLAAGLFFLVGSVLSGVRALFAGAPRGAGGKALRRYTHRGVETEVIPPRNRDG